MDHLLLYFLLVALGLCYYMWAFSAASGGSSVAVHGLLTAVASLAAEHGLPGARASVVAAHGFSGCGAQS